MDSSLQPKLLLDGYTAIHLTHYLAIAGYTITIADYLHTLPDEIRLMWPAPWRTPKVLFFALRYGNLAHIGVHAMSIVPGISPRTCKTGSYLISIMAHLLVVGAEAIMCIRVYAFTGQSKKMKIYLSTQLTVAGTLAFGLLIKYTETVRYVSIPIQNRICMPFEAEGIWLSTTFLILLFNAVSVMLIMVYTAYQKHRDLKSGLFQRFYQDGVVYFVVLSALAAANSIVNFAASPFYTFLLVQPEIFLHAILTTRMLMYLRSWAVREDIEGGAMTRSPDHETLVTGMMTTIQFHSIEGVSQLRSGATSGDVEFH